MPASSKYVDKILDEIKDLSDEQVVNLMKIIHLFKDAIIRQKKYDLEVRAEVEAWDKLSDEALLNFESKI